MENDDEVEISCFWKSRKFNNCEASFVRQTILSFGPEKSFLDEWLHENFQIRDRFLSEESKMVIRKKSVKKKMVNHNLQ